jgi:hypothetical protein
MYGLNNDLFWADQAVKYLPEFKVASLEEGLRFALEAAPRVCFEMNNHELSSAVMPGASLIKVFGNQSC